MSDEQNDKFVHFRHESQQRRSESKQNDIKTILNAD